MNEECRFVLSLTKSQYLSICIQPFLDSTCRYLALFTIQCVVSILEFKPFFTKETRTIN